MMAWFWLARGGEHEDGVVGGQGVLGVVQDDQVERGGRWGEFEGIRVNEGDVRGWEIERASPNLREGEHALAGVDAGDLRGGILLAEGCEE